MNALLNAGQKLVKILEAIRLRLAPLTDRVLDKVAGPRVTPETASSAGMRGFELDAQAVMSTAQTYRAQTLVRSALLVVVLLIVLFLVVLKPF